MIYFPEIICGKVILDAFLPVCRDEGYFEVVISDLFQDIVDLRLSTFSLGSPHHYLSKFVQITLKNTCDMSKTTLKNTCQIMFWEDEEGKKGP